MSATLSPLETMVAKARSLYTLPAVAMEVIRLTDSQQVDTQALKQCIERDPALAAKLLKVVNSSLFGLSGKVENLTQAIALLGIKPLKLLVLGFSLPDGLVSDLDAQQLHSYWRGALTRAVAARQLAQTKWNLPGDEAFLVALLHDLGKLVLLQQLGTPYARFLTQVRSERGRLVDLERSSLGFDHRQLTVALLQSWQLPEMYTAAIAGNAHHDQSATAAAAAMANAQMITLVNLLVELVDEHRLQVLPDLLELGEQYCGLTKDELNKLVAEIEPQIEQLASVLQVDVHGTEHYTQVLAQAHQRLAQVAEEAAGALLGDDHLCDNLLSDARDLQQSIEVFTRKSQATTATEQTAARADAPQPHVHSPRNVAAAPPATESAARQRVAAAVTSAAASCRHRRCALSLLYLEAHAEGLASALSIDCGTTMISAMHGVLQAHHIAQQQVYRLAATSFALVLPEVERRDAVGIAQHLASVLTSGGHSELHPSVPLQLKAAAASIAVIPNGFEPQRLLQAADGCLAAARASGGSATKSIEVY